MSAAYITNADIYQITVKGHVVRDTGNSGAMPEDGSPKIAIANVFYYRASGSGSGSMNKNDILTAFTANGKLYAKMKTAFNSGWKGDEIVCRYVNSGIDDEGTLDISSDYGGNSTEILPPDNTVSVKLGTGYTGSRGLFGFKRFSPLSVSDLAFSTNHTMNTLSTSSPGTAQAWLDVGTQCAATLTVGSNTLTPFLLSRVRSSLTGDTRSPVGLDIVEAQVSGTLGYLQRRIDRPRNHVVKSS